MRACMPSAKDVKAFVKDMMTQHPNMFELEKSADWIKLFAVVDGKRQAVYTALKMNSACYMVRYDDTIFQDPNEEPKEQKTA